MTSEHIKCDSSLSDDDSDEIVIHDMGLDFLLEIYQGPGLGTHRTQTVLTRQAAMQLRSFLDSCQ